MMLVSKDKIQELIPQRSPFVMIDKLIYSDDISTQTEFQVTTENIFLDNNQLSEPALIENIAQTAAARAGYLCKSQNIPVMLGYIGAITELEIFLLPKINDNLETKITVLNQVFDVTLIAGIITCNDQLIAKCEMKIFIIKPK